MLTRLTGILERVADGAGTVVPAGAPFAIEVLLPQYLAEKLGPRVGQAVTLSTLLYLEGQGQGTSFVPRLIGFENPSDRDFFELLTTVKGIGNRKALRSMALPPGAMAGLIMSKDARGLTKLPEIGKRLAETMIAELTGKVDGFLSVDEVGVLDAAAGGRTAALQASFGPAGSEAVEVLVALGDTRPEAERKVETAIRRSGSRIPATADDVLSLVYGG
jgi:holliday junction DNA helicase RuvA